MTAINYIAKRNIVGAELSVLASDISIIASDDSFNSAGGDFIGLVSGDWIQVTGSAVDDGWHQLSIDSTTGKITTTSTLTDESAGSAITINGYKHGDSIAYDLETESSLIDQSFISNTKRSESLSGIVETLLLNNIDYWSITTGYITELELPYWLEFFKSVSGGEAFTIDPYGSTAVEVAPVSCMIEGSPVITRVETIYVYTITFKVRVV